MVLRLRWIIMIKRMDLTYFRISRDNRPISEVQKI